MVIQSQKAAASSYCVFALQGGIAKMSDNIFVIWSRNSLCNVISSFKMTKQYLWKIDIAR